MPDARANGAITAEELVGRALDDHEKRNAPRALYTAGPMSVPLRGARVSVIGTRSPSEEGVRAARAVAEALVAARATVVSGLAAGIDAAAHRAAIDAGGSTIAVIGTPLERAYPAQNAQLQAEIAASHLVVSQFARGSAVSRANFAVRNMTMALISDAAVIVEAGESSGTAYHARETLRLRRPLFVLDLNTRNPALRWPARMIAMGALELSDPAEIASHLRAPARS